VLTIPLGYRFSAVYAGIRKVKKDDLSLIVAERPAAAAAVFTQNRVQAAPVTLCRKHLRATRGHVRAILINAGNANCATRTGDEVARVTSEALAERLKAPVEQVLPASTGVIGVELNSKLITKALPGLVKGLTADRFEDVANAIMTTDLVPKTASREVEIGGRAVRVAGMTKGSGMIQPMMATTLGFVMTDAELSPAEVRAMLAVGVERSYNRISVDGDTSTNDMVALLANGAAGVRPKGTDRELLAGAVAGVLEDLAKQIARDGEGAKKLITIDVAGFADDEAAARVARSIANSPLVKTAIAGSDPNWGRILSAAGNAGVVFDPRRTDVYLQEVLVCEGGLAADFSEEALKKRLDGPDCSVRLVVRGRGTGTARFWTCDLTEDYIRINASYRT
jgi:glutamate N-acetyltransferase / amino-acid N-acetyltransferase